MHSLALTVAPEKSAKAIESCLYVKPAGTRTTTERHNWGSSTSGLMNCNFIFLSASSQYPPTVNHFLIPAPVGLILNIPPLNEPL